MDVVVPVGPDTLWSHNELRYSLRSLLKYGTDVNRIYIVGKRPEFIKYDSRIFHIESKPTTNAKEFSIWQNILKACDDPRISKEFFFTNDDYYFLREFSLENFPNYHKGDLRDQNFAKVNYKIDKSGYDKKAKRTLEFLQSQGLPTLFFDIHCPNRIRKSEFRQCFNSLEEYLKINLRDPNGSLCINTVYLNWIGAKGVFREECKIDNIEKIKISRPLIFSISDRAIKFNLKVFFQEEFNNKQEYEKSDVKKVKFIEKKEVVMAKVTFVVTKRFIDGPTGQQFGPGKWRVNSEMATRLEQSGRGYLESIGYPRITKESPPETLQKVTKVIQGLPEDFPGRDKLIEAGFKTIESLQVENIEKQLSEIPGIGKVTLTKIGLRLAEYGD
jgi:hypothetical protein